jgi:CubicO group peptidase (beta-lactamase class C family)
MSATTFDYARALAGNHASPHGDDVDGNPRVAKLALDYSAIPIRPAGGEWTSAHDLARYVMDEINLGKLTDGRQLVSQENLLMRRKPQIILGEDSWYGMGLIVDKKYGVRVVSHGGSMAGYIRARLLVLVRLRSRRSPAYERGYRRIHERALCPPFARGAVRRCRFSLMSRNWQEKTLFWVAN